MWMIESALGKERNLVAKGALEQQVAPRRDSGQDEVDLPRTPAILAASSPGSAAASAATRRGYCGSTAGVSPIFWQNPASTGRATPVT